jgi:hypothetical protein
MKERAALGLSPDVVAWLPICIANKEPEIFAAIQQYEIRLRTIVRDHGNLLLPRFACMDPPQGKPPAGRRRRPDAGIFTVHLAIRGLIQIREKTLAALRARAAARTAKAAPSDVAKASPCISTGPTCAAPPRSSSPPRA